MEVDIMRRKAQKQKNRYGIKTSFIQEELDLYDEVEGGEVA